MLAGRLPAGAQVYVDAGVDAAWTVTDQLAALAVDAVQVQTWALKGSRGSPPKPVSRPAEIAAERAKNDAAVARAKRYRMRRR